jgi:hypothetical protein
MSFPIDPRSSLEDEDIFPPTISEDSLSEAPNTH